MARVDIDRHILSELVVLQNQIREAQIDFKTEWEEIVAVKNQCEIICELNHVDPMIHKLRERLGRAIKILNTKMICMDDWGSRERALIKHLVSVVEEADTGNGTESHGRNNFTMDSDS